MNIRMRETRPSFTENGVVKMGGILLVAMTLFSIITALLTAHGSVSLIEGDTTIVMASQIVISSVAAEEISDTEELLAVFTKYWKILLRWVLRLHNYPELTPEELYRKLNTSQPPLMIDVRSADDFDGTGYLTYGHIPGSISIPMLELESRVDELHEYKNKEVITICQGGGLSLAAVDVLQEAGFTNVTSLKGGTDLWHKRGYPTSVP